VLRLVRDMAKSCGETGETKFGSPKELWLLLFRASSLCAMPPAAARGHVSMESAGRDIPKFSGDAYQFRQVSV
jgi:hypothetical protein